MPDSLRAVCFDLGGTLFEHLPAAATAHNLRAVLEPALGRALTQPELDRYQQIRRTVEQRFVAHAFFLHRDLVIAASTEFCGGLALSQQQIRALAQQFYTAQQTTVTSQLQLRDDCVAVLQQLQAQGLTLAIVSNIDEDYLQPLLARTPLQRYCAFVLSSEAAGSCKPDPEIYAQALERLSLAPERVLFVGDSYPNDVQGPQHAGMRTAWLIADQEPDAQQLRGAGVVVGSLSELGQWIEGQC